MVNIFEIVKIEGTLRIDTFVDTEKFTIFFWSQSVSAVRAEKLDRDRRSIGIKGMTTNFAEELPSTAIVVVDEMMGASQNGQEISSEMVLSFRC